MTYTLQDNGVRYWTGIAEDGGQVIMGLSIPNILAYVFSPEGNYVQKRVVKLSILPSWDASRSVYRTDANFLKSAEEQIAAIRLEMGFAPHSVRIREFYDEEEDVGIKELPSDFEEYVRNPSRYSAENRASLDAAIREWNDKGLFVFVWGEELWMSQDGEVLSS